MTHGWGGVVMSGVLVDLRYDGPAVADHKMDVADLAPALLAFGTLCKEANRVLNGDKTSVRVFVNADIKANCVTVSFDVVWSFLEAARQLIQDDRVATAKSILEWIGLICAPTGLSLFALLRLRSREPMQETRLIEQDGRSVVEVQIKGDNNVVHVMPEVAKLAADPKVVEAAKRVVRPVAVREGIDRAEFRVNGQRAVTIDKETASAITDAPVPYKSASELEEQYIVGHITVYGPLLDAKAGVWKFKLLGAVQPIDISDSGIAEDVMRRGKIVVGDTWKVRLRVTERRTNIGGFKSEFKVVEVLDFSAGSEQNEFAWRPDDDDA
jgi:hypothetical protein